MKDHIRMLSPIITSRSSWVTLTVLLLCLLCKPESQWQMTLPLNNASIEVVKDTSSLHSFILSFSFFDKFKSLKCKKLSTLAPFTLENISNTFHIQIWQHGVQSIIKAITSLLELLAYSVAIFPYKMAIHISRYFRDGYCTLFSSFCGFI